MQNLLKAYGRPFDGDKTLLLERITSENIHNGVFEFEGYTTYGEDKEIIRNIVVRIAQEGKIVNPSAEYRYVLEKYGYYYMEALSNFIHIRTHEKLYGNTTWADHISLFCYAWSDRIFSISRRETKFTDNECVQISKSKTL